MSRKKTFQQVIDYIDKKHKDYKVLSTEYLGNKSKMYFKCKKGHIFSQRFNNIVNGQWCKKCGIISRTHKRKYSFEFVKCKIKELHPECQIIGTEYKNIFSKIPAICENKHIFKIKPSDLFHKGTWCTLCRNIRTQKRRRTPFEMNHNKIMTSHPSCKIITTKQEYIDGSTEIKILCECGKIFKSNFRRLNTGRWCYFCKTTRTKKTNLKKYGVEYITQVKDVALKAARNLNNSTIKYHWKTGEELVCQGSYESKTVDYLNINKINYEWQPKVFRLSANKTYRPDFHLTEKDKWIEIKGYFRKDALEKWKEFQILQPNSELWSKVKLKEIGIL